MLRGFLLAIGILNGTIKDCSSPESIGTILDMGIDPVNPKPGDHSLLWVEFDLAHEVTGGTATYSYTLNYIPFPGDVIPLCDQTNCPLPAGVNNVSGETVFPDVSGRIEVQIDWVTEDATPIWCVKTTYSV